MGSYLYLFAFMSISIAESNSSDVILSRRRLFWSGLGVLSLLLDWSQGLSVVVCLDDCFFPFSSILFVILLGVVGWFGSGPVFFPFLGVGWGPIWRFGVEWPLGLFFLILSLLRSISARGDLDLVLRSCFGGLVSNFSWDCCYHCHHGPSHLCTCWFCHLVSSCSAWGPCSVYCLMFPFCFYFPDGGWGVTVDMSTGFWSCRNRHLEPYMQYPVW